MPSAIVPLPMTACRAATGAGCRLDGPAGREYAALLEAIRALPGTESLNRRDVLSETFLLHREGRLSIYYAPFDYLNPRARIVLVGITPGWQQMEIAFRVTRQGLHAGLSCIDALRLVKQHASFAGTTRKNLVTMLDGIGVARALDIPSTSALFGDRMDLAHTTSALRYPVLIDGKNYTGHTPRLIRHPTLLRFVRTRLAEELAQLPHALIVPLGDASGAAVAHLGDMGVVDPYRCVTGFPHPSGANGHRAKQFGDRRSQLEHRVQAWYRERPVLVG